MKLLDFIYKAAAVAAIVLSGTVPAAALEADHYAANSVLSSGKWVRIITEGTGMQLVSVADLKAMGFSDISKVNVYGTGGRMVPEALTADMPDDLPLLPSVKTDKGIVFFSTDHFEWKQPFYGSNTPYSHSINPYSDTSYYYLSDRETPDPLENMEKVNGGNVSGMPRIDSFRARLVHEQDLQAPGEAGRRLLGEDFRSTRSRTFNFDLPDNNGASITIHVEFGARTSGAGSSLMFSANGQRLPSTVSDNISVPSSDIFANYAVTEKDISAGKTDKLALTIDYQTTGALFLARLDFIEVFYGRDLKLKNGWLHFYGNAGLRSAYEIDGCSADTQIWDVTNPLRPKKITYVLEGSKAVFVPRTGYKEYVAFEPSQIAGSQRKWEKIENQDIHSLASPDMVIIAPAEYMEPARKIAGAHESKDGLKVIILTPESIYNEFSGGLPDVGAFRKLLKMWHDRGGEHKIKYCLLMGRGTFDNKKVSDGVKGLDYYIMPMWQSASGNSERTAYSTDSYIGMLDDCTAEEFDITGAQQHVAVGRLPVKGLKEAEDVAEKIVKYIETPDFGSWRNQVMIIADDGDYGYHIDQAQDVYTRLHRNENGQYRRYERLYLDIYKREVTSLGPTYPKAKERLLKLWNDGVALTNYIGHASPNSWTHEKLLEWKDFTTLSNKRPTFIYAATCSFGCWDGNQTSAAELMVLNPAGVAIGIITPSRTVYIQQNGVLSNYMAEQMFVMNADGTPPAVGDVYINGMNRYRDDNKLRYCLISDPALRLPYPLHRVVFEKLADVDLATADDLPELKAMSKVSLSGSIAGPDGKIDTDFNGQITIDLYDAERVIETLGQGTNPVVRMFNDRKVKLGSFAANVKDGRWETTVMLPSEIENNYSPALFIGYAWDPDGKEASGTNERFYVYGFDDKSADDTAGPEIHTFYINDSAFEQGGVVNSNPVVFASFSDESGINLSESGVGHKLLLTLDGKEYFDDVSSYFTADPSEPGSGSIIYPMTGLAPGKHTLELSVSDNVNNTTRAQLDFNVGVNQDPVIRDLRTNVNPATTSVTITVSLDRPNTKMKCTVDVFDLMGRRVWSSNNEVDTDIQSRLQVEWNLKDGSGVRVNRGIYLYRATVETPEGMYTSKTKKLAVAGEQQ